MIPLSDDVRSHRAPIITIALILLNIYFFYLEMTSPSIEEFFLQFALIPALVNWSDPASLLTFLSAMFVHGGLLHIASNMLFLWVFGDNVEERLGRFWYLVLYLGGGLLANLAQYAMDPQLPIPIVGASGAVAAVLGSYFVFFPHHSIKTLVPIFFIFTLVHVPAWLMLIYWFGLQFFNGLASVGETAATGGVAYLAHVVGFAAGLVIALIARQLKPAEVR